MTEPAARLRVAAFDPTTRVFVAMDARPAALKDIDPAGLSPRLRALLTIDGTVTQFLESYTGEPVRVELLDQVSCTAGEAADWLDCAPVEPVLRRSSILVGAESGQLYAFAESLILPARLVGDMQAGLHADPGGLGKIILDSELETRREALWYGVEPAGELPAAVATHAPAAFLTRSYRIFSAGRPMMQITERFPLSAAGQA